MVYQLGNEEQALVVLEQALQISHSGGYIRVFDQSVILDQLLHLANKRGICPTSVDEICLRSVQREDGKLKLQVAPGPCGNP